MPQEPRTRRGFIRAAGLLAGGTAVAAVPQAGAAQAVTAAGEASAVLSAGHARTLAALAETAADLFPALVPAHGVAAARYAALPPAERERVRRAAEALGSDLAGLTRRARIARLGSRLNGPRAADVETALGLLTGAPPGDGRPAVDEERGRLLGRALRAAAGSDAPAAPAEPISPFVV